jgi:hypothetical protein
MRAVVPPAVLIASVLAVGCEVAAPVTTPRRPATAIPEGAGQDSGARTGTLAHGPALLSAVDVDRMVRSAWQRGGVTPTPPASDAVWLRRAWIDVLGTIPPPEVTSRFLVDPAADKRSRAIDEMLASPHWAEHWTAYWDDAWMGRDTRGGDVDRGAFRSWLHDAFARDLPWSTIVTSLLTATGVNSAGRSQHEALAAEGDEPPPPGVNGAVNWTLRYRETPQDMAGSASRTLLGVQIQCAQCHDHKTEHWTQRDFQSFAAAFVRTRIAPLPDGKTMGQIARVQITDLERPAPRLAKMGDLQPIVSASPRGLDGTPLDGPEGVRAALARWVTSVENPWFGRAFVNRMWGHFLGRGFVDPVDDLRPSNPASSPELYEALTADFSASGFDVKHLVRVIVGSEPYARSAAPLNEATARADPDTKLWERFRVTPLGPDELLNALVAATGVDDVVRATGRLDLAQVRFRMKQRYGFLFDVDEESDALDYEGTIAQALALLNGSVVSTGASRLPGTALASILVMPQDDAAKIEALYVRALSRKPTTEETARWMRYIEDTQALPASAGPSRPPARIPDAGVAQPDPLGNLANRAGRQHADAQARAYEDLLWTLLNSSEFSLNH